MSRTHDTQKFKKCRRYNDSGHAHALNFCCYQNQKFLSRERTCAWLVKAIQRARNKHAFDLWAYVIMPEHVHLLICPRRNDYSVSKILQSIKKSVALTAINYVKEKQPSFLSHMLDLQPNGASHYRFWERGGGFDRNIYSQEALALEIDYMHMNPVRRQLCEQVVDWKWSSAADYQFLREGPLKIDFHSLPGSLHIEK